MRVRYQLEDAEGGTTVAIHASGEPGGFFGLLTPLMAGKVRSSISADLQRLKACLERE